MPKFVGGRPTFPPEICAQSDKPPFLTAQFRPIFAYSALTGRVGEKSLISTNRKSTTRFPTSHIDEPCTLPLRPPTGGTKRDFAIFPVNFNFCRIKSGTKFLCVKSSSGKVVATSFLYLMVYRRIAGNVSIYLKFALKGSQPRRKTPISINYA